MLSVDDLCRLRAADSNMFDFLLAKNNGWVRNLLDEIVFEFFPAYYCSVCQAEIPAACEKNHVQTPCGPVCLACVRSACFFCHEPSAKPLGLLTIWPICSTCSDALRCYAKTMLNLDLVRPTFHKHEKKDATTRIFYNDRCFAVTRPKASEPFVPLLVECQESKIACPYCLPPVLCEWRFCFRHSQCRFLGCERENHEPTLTCAEHYAGLFGVLKSAWAFSRLNSPKDPTLVALEAAVKRKINAARSMTEPRKQAVWNLVKQHLNNLA